MTNPLTASAIRLRMTLFIGMGLAVMAIVALAIYGVKYLDGYATEVNAIVYESTTSNDRLAAIRQQVEALENNTSSVERARQIVAESKSYRYQDVIVRDLQSFADKAGIKIVSFDFSSGNSEETSAPAAPAADAADPSAATEGGDANASADPAAGAAPAQPVSQLKSTTVNISLENPVGYRQLLQFIHYVEQNLTKMQISSVSLSGSQEDASSVTIDALTVEVYIR